MSGTDKSRVAAADALMEALEEWACSLGDAGVRKANNARYFPSRQMHRMMRTAYSEGVLFERLTEWLPNYRFRGDVYTERMKDIVRHGAELWEAVVAAEDRGASDTTARYRRSSPGCSRAARRSPWRARSRCA